MKNLNEYIEESLLDKLKTLFVKVKDEDIIKEKFGNEFVFETTHKTLTIDRKVIREFNKIKGENIVWDKDRCCWH